MIVFSNAFCNDGPLACLRVSVPARPWGGLKTSRSFQSNLSDASVMASPKATTIVQGFKDDEEKVKGVERIEIAEHKESLAFCAGRASKKELEEDSEDDEETASPSKYSFWTDSIPSLTRIYKKSGIKLQEAIFWANLFSSQLDCLGVYKVLPSSMYQDMHQAEARFVLTYNIKRTGTTYRLPLNEATLRLLVDAGLPNQSLRERAAKEPSRTYQAFLAGLDRIDQEDDEDDDDITRQLLLAIKIFAIRQIRSTSVSARSLSEPLLVDAFKLLRVE